MRTMSNERKQSKLDELIQKYCPEGVSYISIKDLIKQKSICTITPSFKIKRNDYKESGSVPIISQEQEYISGYCERSDNNITQKNYVCFGDHSEHIKYVDFAFVQGADGLKIMHTNENIILARYLYHTALAYYKRHDNYERHFKYFGDTAIPLPPLEVQSEIVRILDKFTDLTAELTAELTARKKQYEYYRDALLTFDGVNIPLRELRSVVKKSCSGSTPTKGNSEYYTNGTIPWIRTQDVRFNEITGVNSYITEKALAETAVKWIPENCVIVAISGATAGRCAINKIKATTNQHCLNLEIDEKKALYKYIYYCVYSKYDELISRKQGARGDLNSSLVLSLNIPVPSLDVQKRVVNVLDNFDAICSDLNIGLPAEIEARKKQYEF